MRRADDGRADGTCLTGSRSCAVTNTMVCEACPRAYEQASAVRPPATLDKLRDATPYFRAASSCTHAAPPAYAASHLSLEVAPPGVLYLPRSLGSTVGS
jgi:hypothetical protein